ncbi:ATP-binding protein [Pseudaeromonas sp. ZJS20]|uniref:ATP-binding protein n=1 Tax=Pseudaeromonas aegiceratis TaxID=3153928 RepID=UPI00390C933B
MTSIFWRILLTFWLTLVLLLGGIKVGTVLYEEYKSKLDDPLDVSPMSRQLMETFGNTIRQGGVQLLNTFYRLRPVPPPDMFGPPNGNNGLLENDLKPERMPPPEQQIRVTDAQGREQLGMPMSPEIWARVQPLIQQQDPRILSVTAPNGMTYYLFRLRDNNSPSGFFFLLHHPLTMPLLMMLASLLCSALLAAHLAKPIRLLRDGLRQVADGRFDLQIGRQMGNRHDELGQLGRDADLMAQRLNSLIGAQQRLLHDVSHDLRSPLARVQVALGLARQSPDRFDDALSRIEHETHRLNQMIEEVLTLAKLEAKVPITGDDYLDLVSLLQSLVDDARFEYAAEGRHFDLLLDAEDDILLHGRAELLLRAFDNLIRNAAQHSPRGTPVHLTVSVNAPAGQVVVSCCDQGPGVPECDLETIFTPFYHHDQSQGKGLGLAIAKRAIEAHGGTILARNRSEGGLAIIATLPIAQASMEEPVAHA